ncbi:MAG: peptidyl-alpha-hydroxyglycine alpha-amidating lyase family protein [Gemmatimonadota bacterium]|jgi:DNA-binding beta-propeller fold protein YncE
MSGKNHLRAAGLALAAMTVLPMVVAAQADMAPNNDLPNPYRTIEGWNQMPAGRSFGSSSSVDIDADGTSVWVVDRCSTNSRGCLINSDLDPIMKFDADGNMVTSFGAGMLVWPHGIDVDPDGNIWVVDGQDNRPQTPRGGGAAPPMPDHIYGHQVIKFSPTGQVLMRLGVEGGVPMDEMAAAGPGHDFFWQPNDVYVAGNGDIFVGEGHGSGRNRIIKFNSRGEYLMEWGQSGDGPGQFNQPHSLAMDSQGRLFVADRGNNRIQIFDQDGRFLDMWYQFSRNSGIYIDANDILYAADSESGSVNPAHGDWTRGIRVGSARTGEVWALIPDPHPDCRGTCTAEGVAADINGVIYGAEVGPAPGRLQRYVEQ